MRSKGRLPRDARDVRDVPNAPEPENETSSHPARKKQMDIEAFIESEAAAALKRCELLAAAWGLSVAIRDSREVPAVRMAECSGLFIPAVDAMKFGIPAGAGLAVVDVQQLLSLWDPVGRICSVAGHEVAHAAADAVSEIEFPQLPSDPKAEPTIWTPTKLAGIGRPPWLGHDSKFLQAASHVAFRMWEADLPVSLEWMVNHEAYSLSLFASYFTELRVECERLADRPIVQALRTRAPESFLRLWREDVARAAEKNSGSSRRSLSPCHYSEEPSSENV
jgi:hypothetical protein